MPRILLFGAGAIGLIYAYFIDKAGADLTLVCRSNFDAVSANGVSIDSAVFGNVSFRPHTALKSCTQATESYDFLVVCCKVHPGIPELIAPAVSDRTVIVLIQNGIGTEQVYCDAFPGNTILTGAVYIPTEQVRPGHVVMGSIERLELGTYPADAGAAAKQDLDIFAELVRNGGGTVSTFEDVQEQRWLKLAVNVTWSPVCALTLLDNTNFILSSDDSIEVATKITEEIIEIARAKGYTNIDASTFNKQFGRSRQNMKKIGREPSMLGDVRAGRLVITVSCQVMQLLMIPDSWKLKQLWGMR